VGAAEVATLLLVLPLLLVELEQPLVQVVTVVQAVEAVEALPLVDRAAMAATVLS
jgi:hypothetical protein